MSGPAVYSRDTPQLAQARQLFQQRRYDEALALFDRAVRSEPHNVQAIVDAIRAHGRRYQDAQAEALIERLIKLADDRADLLQLAGESYLFLHRPTLALETFKRACRGAGRVLESQVHLAELYERSGQLDLANELIGRALALAPDFDRARLVRAKVQRRRGELANCESSLRGLAARAGPSQAEALGLLSEVLDLQGDYDGAFSAALECKRVLLPKAQKPLEAADFVHARFAQMIDSVTGDHFERWQPDVPAAARHRVALLTGFPRSGTTLLEKVLEAHPGIVSSEEHDVLSREIFPSLVRRASLKQPIIEVLESLPFESLAQHRALYLMYMESLLGEPIGDRVHLDKNPAMNPMLPIVRRLFPEMKLLVALRDPRDVIVSCFLRYLPLNPVSVCFLTLERAVQRYALDMNAWLRFREMLGGEMQSGGWLEVRYEHLVADLPGQARGALELLGLPWSDSILEYRDRAAASPVRSPSYADVARPIYSSAIGRWRNYERQMAPVLASLEPFVTSLGYDI